jgi:hypothetical protein
MRQAGTVDRSYTILRLRSQSSYERMAEWSGLSPTGQPMPMKKLRSTSAVVFVSLGVAACGSGSGASSTTGAARPQGGGGFAARLTSAQQSCIKKQGVTLPSGRPGGRPGGGSPSGDTNAQPPTGTNGTPPNGGRPGGFNRNSAQAKKMRAAFQACGIQMPQRPGSAAPAASNG